VLLLYLKLRPGRAADERTTRFLGSALPLGFSYLVTFGIPPLLFVQVIYGQFFYSSSVLLGAHWIMVIPLVIVGYGAAYLHKLTRHREGSPQRLWIAVSLLAMLAIGFIYVNNLTLSMTPEKWLASYERHPGGMALNLSEPTLLPRYLLILTPCLAVAGLALLLRGGFLLARKQEEAGRTSQRLGFAALVGGVLLFLGMLGAFLARLPGSVRAAVVGGGVLRWLLVGAAACAVLALVLGTLARKRAGLLRPLAAAVALAGAIACLVVLRDQIRIEYLRPYLATVSPQLNAQWGMVGIFGASLVAGLVFLIVVTARVVSGMVRGVGTKQDAPAA